MTEDELVEAIRHTVEGRDVPPPASREAITATERACGYALPPLLVRLLTTVANGGFGPRPGAYGVCGHDFHSAELFADMTEAALAAAGEPMWCERRWCLPPVDWGCAISTWVDCRDPSGPLWGWDPHMCCFDHAFFPLDQTLAEMLTAWLAEQRRDVFYPGYFDDLKRASPPGVCAPLVWRAGRIDVAASLAARSKD
jgi:hypothetical protein